MFWIALSVLGPYFTLYLFDEWRRRTRAVSRRESRRRIGVAALHAVIFAYLCFLPAAAWWWPCYGALAFLNVALRLLADADRAAQVDGTERLLHGILQTMQAPLWILVATLWEFIDGAGFFLGLVLPVSMRGLRPLVQGAAIAWTVVCVLQIVLSFRRTVTAEGVALVPVAGPMPQETPASTDLPKAS